MLCLVGRKFEKENKGKYKRKEIWKITKLFFYLSVNEKFQNKINKFVIKNGLLGSRKI